MPSVVRSAWPLFLGVALIMVGNGLQGSLIGIRATQAGFPTTATGLIMSGYFAGFLLGSALVPRLISVVGHVRVFAAMASVASTAVLLHVLFVNVPSWVLMRVATGFCYAGLYIVAESWINDRATNETRGKLFAVYMLLVLGGMAGGQLLLNIDDASGADLFILSSILISFALVPMLLSGGQAPAFEKPESVSMMGLYRLSPLGVVASFGTGMAHGLVLGMGAVYAEGMGLSLTEISLFLAAIYVGGMLFQFPIGALSDRFDRRMMLTTITLLAGTAAIFAGTLTAESGTLLLVITCIFGGMCLPLYSVCVAHTNDNLTPEQMVAASGTLYMCVGIGAAIGPVLGAFFMGEFGPPTYFFCLAIIHALIGLFALYRMTRRQAVPLAEQGPALQITSATSALATSFSTEAAIEQMDEDDEDSKGLDW
ncbi:MAG: MFS transporter [Pseudomonadota bacterium]